VHPYDPARVVAKELAGCGLGGWVRALLYTDPALRLFGHMVLVVAKRR